MTSLSAKLFSRRGALALFTALMVISMASTGWAKKPGKEHGMERGHGMGPMEGMKDMPFYKNLTDKQKKDLDALHEEHKNGMKAHMEAMQPLHQQMMEAMHAYPVNAAKAKDIHQQMAGHMAELHQLRVDHMVKMQQILGEKNWKEWVAEHEKKMKDHMKEGHHGMGGW